MNRKFSTPARHPRGVMTYPDASIESKLGMDAVRSLTCRECLCEASHRLVYEARPQLEYDTVLEELTRTAEMKTMLLSDKVLSLSGIADTSDWLSRLQLAGTYIEVDELSALRRCMQVARDVKNFFETPENPYPRLGELASNICNVADLIAVIDKVLTPNAVVKDNATPQLSDIRRRMSTIQGRISSAVRRVMNSAISEGLIEADTKPAVREGRIVLPVAAMNKRRLPGIVHDESASGKTYFIEPAEVVELNNEQRELQIEERHEIIRILIDVANSLRPSLSQLAETFSILISFDFIRAKARFAVLTGGELPKLKKWSVIEWHDARHPILRLNLEANSRTVVPMDIDLTKDTARILVISGPNAGGKSVALKTVGINQYMLQAGFLPVMDANSRAGIFDGIYVDLGDEQSLEDDLSTYSSHLRNMKFILQHGTDRSLFLIDEFGAGTEPQIGGAIAQALLADFNAKGMWGVVTTHYQNLKQLAQESDGIINGSMVYDRQQMKPTFKLAIGNSGSSFAVEIALRTGIPRNIIDEAERIVGSDYFNLDKYLLDINRDRRYWENKRNDIKRREKHLEDVISRYEENAENLRMQRRAIIDEAKNEADNIIARSNAAIEQTIRTIRETEADKEQTRRARQQLAEERKAIAETEAKENKTLNKAPVPKKKKQPKQHIAEKETFEVGQNVLLDNQGQPGQVLEIKKDKAVVSFGPLKMTVPLNRLSKTIRKAGVRTSASETNSTLSKQTIEANRQRQLAFNTEIDVRGMRADEAIQAVTYFIDDAMQFNAGRVRILHGTGTGALRVAIRQYLKTVPGVSSFHDEDVRFGGAGITIVNL